MKRADKSDDEQGQSLVELALVLTLLCVLCVGATSIALAVSEYMRVVNAVNAAAQYASTGTAESTDSSHISGVVKSELGSLYPSSGGSITSSTFDDGTGEGMTEVKVTVSVPYQLVIPFFQSNLTLTRSAVMRVNPYGT